MCYAVFRVYGERNWPIKGLDTDHKGEHTRVIRRKWEKNMNRLNTKTGESLGRKIVTRRMEWKTALDTYCKEGVDEKQTARVEKDSNV